MRRLPLRLAPALCLLVAVLPAGLTGLPGDRTVTGRARVYTSEVGTLGAPGVATPGAATTAADLSRLPVAFEPNFGQFDSSVAFVARAKGMVLLLGRDGAMFTLPGPPESPPESPPDSPPGDPVRDAARHRTQVVAGFRFAGANSSAAVVGEEEQAGISNYFYGSDPANWRTGVPNYSKVRYAGLYPGVDLVFYEAAEGSIEYDFIVEPGADPSQITLVPEGAAKTEIAADGSLAMATEAGSLVQRHPIAYQPGRGEVPASFAIDGGVVGFRVAEYDRNQALVIDPVVLAYSSYHGGSGDDSGKAVAVSSSRNAYFTGSTVGTTMPVTGGVYQTAGGGAKDAFVAKVASNGASRVFSTFYGGSSDDEALAIALDSSDNAYVAGSTQSTDLPVTGGFQGSSGGSMDGFVAKLNSSGSSLLYGSYLGGSGVDAARGVTAGDDGSAYVVGSTSSSNFPVVVGGFQTTYVTADAFLAKVNAAGSSLAYCTFHGGGSTDVADSVAVDSSGNAHVTGYTYSTDLPAVNALQPSSGGGSDAWLLKANASGTARTYSTYIGGSSNDFGRALALDSAGNVYVVGKTASANFPTVGPYQAGYGGGTGDGFIVKFNPPGTSRFYATYLGGSGDDDAKGVAVDASGAPHLVGYTSSGNMPVAGAFQSTRNGPNYDAWVGKMNSASTEIHWLSYHGGTGDEYGEDIALDSQGAAYIAGQTYSSSNYPAAGPFQASFGGGGSDAFLARVKVTPGPERANVEHVSGAQSVGPAHRPSVSSDQRKVVYHSPAADLLAGDSNGAGDVFQHTIAPPPSAPMPFTTRISVKTDETQASGGSRYPVITPNGRYVAFMSDAPDLVAGDTNGAEDIFVRDIWAGSTERVSLSDGEAQAEAGKDSRFPQITPDGRYVAFQSQAGNLVAGDTNGRWDIFVRDRSLGTTERVSVSTSEAQANTASARPAISDDGRYVAFHSWASNLVGGDTNGAADVFIRDRSLGSTSLVSKSTGGVIGNGDSQFPQISGSGGQVVFHSMASNLVGGDTNGVRDTFVRLPAAGTTERVSTTSAGAEANGQTGYAAIAAGGRYVVFHGTASNLATGDVNGLQDVFVKDRTTGQIFAVSKSAGGGFGNGVSGSAAISHDSASTYIAFHSDASNLVGGDSNGARDVFYTLRPTA